MIKLNNKKITYVALADSNNSIKAPKEIWYADSNNSVKLVYRRKDALIEGEDYEKYHWLVGDADAYINTLKYYRPYDDSVQMTFRDNLYPNRESKYNKYNAEEQIWGACETNNLQSVLIRSYVSGGSAPNSFCNNIIDGSTADSAVSWGTYAANYINKSPEHSLYISSVDANTDKYYFIYNGNTKSNLPTRYTLPELVQQDVCIFYSGILTNGYFNGSFSNFIHYRNNIEITHLIPCKLLKPVPKWLDANGIRRQVGECGMIDLVSGKFYGNVNSVGTFTVENYYERKEWLQGRNGAYIDTMHPLTAIDDTMRVHAHYDGVTRNPSGGEQAICGVVEDMTDTNKLWAYIYIGTDNNLNAYQRGIYRYSIYGLQTDTVNSLEFIASISNDGNNFKFTKNSNSITESSPITRKTYGNVYLFNRNTMTQPELVQQRYFQGDIASFQIGDPTFTTLSVNMIPCTLTMDLPASMDAKNIARTKGTSGMWDLVSDRFYGNVANSGTFKAVNLAEGVDYEVHQWLGSASGKPYINVQDDVNTDENAYIETTYKCNYSNPHTDIIIGFSITESNNLGIRIFNANKHTYVDYHKMVNGVLSSLRMMVLQSDINAERYIKATFDKLIIDNTEYQISLSDGFDTINQRDTRLYFNSSNNAVSYKRTKIRANNIEYDFIPVKLLKSIPAKYDANGIARQAGECGMYDTVNDVFYGNVASSGTFTVSDD